MYRSLRMEEDLKPIIKAEDLQQLNTLLILLPTDDKNKQTIKQLIDTLLAREASLCQKVYQLLDSAASIAFEENNFDLSELNRKNIKLESDLKKAWNLLEVSHQKDMEQIAHIFDLTTKIDTILANGNDLQLLAVTQENKELKLERNDFNDQNKQLLKDKSELIVKLELSEENYQILTSKSLQLDSSCNEAQIQITNLEEALNQKSDDYFSIKGQIEYKEIELNSRNELIHYLKEEVKKLEKSLADERTTKDGLFKEIETCNNTIKKLESLVKGLKKDRQDSEAKSKLIEFEMKSNEKEIEGLMVDKLVSDRAKDNLTRKLQHLESRKMENKLLIESKDAQVANLNREITHLKEEVHYLNDANKLNTMNAEKYKANNMELHDKLSETQHSCQKYELDIANQRKNVKTFQEEAVKMRSLIQSFEKQQEDYESELASKSKQFIDINEELHNLKSELWEQTQKTTEFKRKLTNQQNLYEQARSDRNRYAKDVMDSGSELKDSKLMIESLTHQITQLEQQLQTKNDTSSKDHFSLLKVSKEKENLISDYDLLNKQFQSSKSRIEELKLENEKFNDSLRDATDENTKANTNLNDVLRKVEIQSQSIEKKIELNKSLILKIERLDSLCSKSETLVIEKEDSIKLMKDEINNLKKKIRLMELHGMNTTKLQQDIIELKKEVLNEQLRNKALEENLERPQNIHRWRSIQAVDPDKYLLMEKVADLQKRVIKKDDVVAKKSVEIESLQKLVYDLNKIISRVPSPELSNQVEILKSTDEQKNDGLKSLESEVMVYKSELNIKNMQMDEYKQQMITLKTRYMALKRKMRKVK